MVDSSELRHRIVNDVTAIRKTPNPHERAELHEMLREEPYYQEYRSQRHAERREFITRRAQERSAALASTPETNPVEQSEEQAILWAESFYEKFKDPPTGKSREVRNANAQFENALLIDGINLAYIDSIASVWKTRSMDAEGKIPPNSVYERAKKALAKDFEVNWEYVKPELLARVTKAYVDSPFVADFTHDILAGYFKGPRHTEERAFALQYLAMAGVVSKDDPQTLEKIVEIGLFKTDILPASSYFARDIFLKKDLSLLDPNTESLGIKIQTATHALLALSELTSIGGMQAYITLHEKFMQDPAFLLSGQTEARKLRHKLGKRKIKAYVNKVNQTVDEITDDEIRGARDMDKLILRNQNQINLPNTTLTRALKSVEHPLTQVVSELVVPEAKIKAYSRVAKDFLKGYDVFNPLSLSITTPSGEVVDIFMPSEYADRKKNILARILQETTQKPLANPYEFYKSQFMIDEKPVLYHQRMPIPQEGDPHPINTLEAFGFPQPTFEGESLGKATQKLRTEVEEGQRYFIGSRGISIPFDQEVLKELGYSKFEIGKDQRDPSKLQAKIYVGGIAYNIALDKHFNFDFEGKKINAPLILDSLHYTVLSYLKPILCADPESGSDALSPEGKKAFFDRAPYLMLLPEGKNRTERAKGLCLKNEGRDLLSLDAQKRLDMVKRETPVPENRQYTYVSPVHIEREEELPPVEIKLPNAVSFTTPLPTVS